MTGEHNTLSVLLYGGKAGADLGPARGNTVSPAGQRIKSSHQICRNAANGMVLTCTRYPQHIELEARQVVVGRYVPC